MINMAVQLLSGQLNQYLIRTYNLNEDVVVISNLVDLDGSVAPNVNLQVMMAVHFNGNNYPEALKFIFSTIIFFQCHPSSSIKG